MVRSGEGFVAAKERGNDRYDNRWSMLKGISPDVWGRGFTGVKGLRVQRGIVVLI